MQKYVTENKNSQQELKILRNLTKLEKNHKQLRHTKTNKFNDNFINLAQTTFCNNNVTMK